jgi:hypothetical protein
VNTGKAQEELAGGALAPILVWAVALSCGVFAALALQIYLGAAGFDLATLWHNLSSAGGRDLRTTGPWWAIAGAGFLGGGAVAAALGRLPLPWQRFRLLRWAIGALLVLLLAWIGDSEPAPAAVGVGAEVGVRLAALGLGAIGAGIGAALALRR